MTALHPAAVPAILAKLDRIEAKLDTIIAELARRATAPAVTS